MVHGDSTSLTSMVLSAKQCANLDDLQEHFASTICNCNTMMNLIYLFIYLTMMS